jgi:hypothetical protein
LGFGAAPATNAVPGHQEGGDGAEVMVARTVKVKLKRDRCEQCGAALAALPRFFVVHDGPRRKLMACRSCVEDMLNREHEETRAQAQELEFFWTLTSARWDEGDTDDPSRRAPVP